MKGGVRLWIHEVPANTREGKRINGVSDTLLIKTTEM